MLVVILYKNYSVEMQAFFTSFHIVSCCELICFVSDWIHPGLNISFYLEDLGSSFSFLSKITKFRLDIKHIYTNYQGKHSYRNTLSSDGTPTVVIPKKGEIAASLAKFDYLVLRMV